MMWNNKEFKTTFPMDFTIADHFGVNGVKETYDNAFKYWRDDVIYLAELVITLNWKIWQYYKTREDLARVYNDLWEKTHNWALDHLKGDDLRYYLEQVD